MFKKTKKCIVCQKEVSKDSAIKRYQNFFCSSNCLKEYEKLLAKARNESSLKDCC